MRTIIVITLSLLLFACAGVPPRAGVSTGGGAPGSGESASEAGAPDGSPSGSPEGESAGAREEVPESGGSADSFGPSDPVAEEYLREAREAEENLETSKALALLIRARNRNPGSKRIERALSSLTRSLESEGRYVREAVRKGKGLSSPLQFVLSVRRGAELFPVPDMPVRFGFVAGGGVLTGDAVTDDLGIAKCYVEEITEAEDAVRIEANVALRVDGAVLELDALAQTYEFETLSLFDLPHCLFVDLETRKAPAADMSQALCGRLLSRLGGKGFSRVSCASGEESGLFLRAFGMDRPAITLLGNQAGARVLVLLGARTDLLSQQSPKFFLSTADISVKIVDVRTFALYFEVTVSDKGAGTTQADSEIQAILNAAERLVPELDGYAERAEEEQ